MFWIEGTKGEFVYVSEYYMVKVVLPGSDEYSNGYGSFAMNRKG